jgi:hypothetical protein
MADYYSIIAKAVSTLDPNTREARRRLYGRARAALLAEIRRAYPPLDQSDIMATRKSLEEAIGKVETQAQREQRAHQAPADALSLPSLHQQPRERKTASPPFRATIADYYSLVAKATNALDAHTEEARLRVYDRARAAFVSEVHKLAPALDQSEIMAEQFYLELAIGEVEAEQREQSARSTVGNPATVFPRGAVVAAPSAQANQNDQEVCGSRTRAYRQDLQSGVTAPARYPEQYGQPADRGDCERLRDTWLTDLLARASRGGNNDQTDFTPKRALRHTG